jgi:hypothetical protein
MVTGAVARVLQKMESSALHFKSLSNSNTFYKSPRSTIEAITLKAKLYTEFGRRVLWQSVIGEHRGFALWFARGGC